MLLIRPFCEHVDIVTLYVVIIIVIVAISSIVQLLTVTEL